MARSNPTSPPIRSPRFLRLSGQPPSGEFVNADCPNPFWALPVRLPGQNMTARRYFCVALLPVRDTLEGGPHHLQREWESKRPSHRETQQNNFRDHSSHLWKHGRSRASFRSRPSSISETAD
jgi:hypothetical protein